jgi:hypothetical protein
MPPELLDEELDTSTSTPPEETGSPAVDAAPVDDGSTETATAGGGEGSDQQPGDKATAPKKQSAPSEKPTGALASVLDHLSEKDAGKTKKAPTGAPPKTAAEAKPDATKAAPVKAPAKDPKAAQPKPSDDALTPDDLRAPERTRKRIESLLADRKTDRETLTKVQAEYEQAKPIIEQGKAFADVVKSYGLSADLKGMTDDDTAGAIQFQGAVVRLTSGKGTKSDLDAVTATFAQLDKTREMLGLAPTAAPAVDAEAFKAAVAKARNDLEFGDLQALIDGLGKQATKTERPAQRQPLRLVEEQPARERQPQAQQKAENADDRLYEAKAIERFTTDGQADPTAYFEGKVYPRILAELKTIYQGKNPAQVFDSLSAQGKHDATIRAHEFLQKQAQRLQPKGDKPAPQHRPNGSGGTAPAWASKHGPASTSAAAVSHLAGD